MFRNRCAVDGCRSASSRPICLHKAGLLVSYRHVRFREETEPVRGEATPLVLLRDRKLAADLLGLASCKSSIISSCGYPATRADAWVVRNTLSIDAIGASRREAAEKGGEDPAELNRKSSRATSARRAPDRARRPRPPADQRIVARRPIETRGPAPAPVDARARRET